MCGGRFNDCYNDAVQEFKNVRGDIRDGIQLEEIVAYLEKRIEANVDEIMEEYDWVHGNKLGRVEEHKMYLDA